VQLALRSELAAFSNKELRVRAKAQGASAEEFEETADSDEPREALLALLNR
jgi:hypothetical protein